jgi:hypothetical protein
VKNFPIKDFSRIFQYRIFQEFSNKGFFNKGFSSKGFPVRDFSVKDFPVLSEGFNYTLVVQSYLERFFQPSRRYSPATQPV